MVSRVTPRFDDYREVVGPQVWGTIRKLADKLTGLNIKMVNSTAVGGGVAEILHGFVPLMNDVGIRMLWEVMEGDEEFFRVTKTIHNALHGRREELTQQMQEIYHLYTERNLNKLDSEQDFIFIHDPQPAGLIQAKKDGQTRWVWRCHIDVSAPYSQAWEFLKPYILQYDASIFSAPSFAKELPIPQYMIAPSIDPLSERNTELPQRQILRYLEKNNIDPKRPILTQISRFDKLKDPVGVIKTYQLVKRSEDCQLVLAGGGAADDPESVHILPQIYEAAGKDQDIHIIELTPPSYLEVNMLQRASTIVIQKSLREGFALTITEALWKKKPVVATAVGGIPLQVIHNYTGLLVHSIEGAALKIVYLLRNPHVAKMLGENGREHVRQNFLITRLVRDYLVLLIAMQRPGEKVIHL
jgi:trehalose synthase